MIRYRIIAAEAACAATFLTYLVLMWDRVCSYFALASSPDIVLVSYAIIFMSLLIAVAVVAGLNHVVLMLMHTDIGGGQSLRVTICSLAFGVVPLLHFYTGIDGFSCNDILPYAILAYGLFYLAYSLSICLCFGLRGIPVRTTAYFLCLPFGSVLGAVLFMLFKRLDVCLSC